MKSWKNRVSYIIQGDVVLLLMRLAALVVVALSTYGPAEARDTYYRWAVLGYFALSELILLVGSRPWIKEGITIGIYFLDIFALTFLIQAREFSLLWYLVIPMLILGTSLGYRRRGGWLPIALIPSVFILYRLFSVPSSSSVNLLELAGTLFLFFAFAWAVHFVLSRMDRFRILYWGQRRLVQGIADVSSFATLQDCIRIVLDYEMPLTVELAAILFWDGEGNLRGQERKRARQVSEVRIGHPHVPGILLSSRNAERYVGHLGNDEKEGFFQARKVQSILVYPLDVLEMQGIILFGRSDRNAFAPDDREIISLYADMIRGWLRQSYALEQMKAQSGDLPKGYDERRGLAGEQSDLSESGASSERAKALEAENRQLKQILDEQVRSATHQLHQASLAFLARESEVDRQVLERLASTELARAVTLLFDLDTVLGLILEVLCEKLGVAEGSIMIFREKSDDLVVKVQRGLDEEVARRTRIMLGEAIAGYAVHKREPLLIADIKNNPRFIPFQFDRYRSGDLLSVPVLHDDKVLGVINLIGSERKSPLTEGDLEILQALSYQAAIAVVNDRLYSRFKNGARIRDAYEKSLAARVSKEVLEDSQVIEGVEGEYKVSVLMVRFHEEGPAMSHLESSEKILQIERDYQAVRDIVCRHQGDVAGGAGAGLTALFGVPFPGKEDSWRALMAAVDLLRSFAKRNKTGGNGGTCSTISVSVATGDVLLRKQQGAVPYAASGESWMRALVLMQAGAPGQILIDERTYRRVQDRVNAVRLVLPHGINRRLTAYGVKGIKPLSAPLQQKTHLRNYRAVK
jgi:class 3 adenylate cyclase/putative methionine-R-sulfoxide reductase with GAF domain